MALEKCTGSFYFKKVCVLGGLAPDGTTAHTTSPVKSVLLLSEIRFILPK